MRDPGPQKRVAAIFYRTETGGEPLRDWLRSVGKDDKRRIGEDIKTVEFGWPLGMPLARPLGEGLFEVRTRLVGHRIPRIIFYIDARQRMVLLHGFIKKTQGIPVEDLHIARGNKARHERGLRSKHE